MNSPGRIETAARRLFRSDIAFFVMLFVVFAVVLATVTKNIYVSYDEESKTFVKQNFFFDDFSLRMTFAVIEENYDLLEGRDWFESILDIEVDEITEVWLYNGAKVPLLRSHYTHISWVKLVLAFKNFGDLSYEDAVRGSCLFYPFFALFLFVFAKLAFFRRKDNAPLFLALVIGFAFQFDFSNLPMSSTYARVAIPLAIIVRLFAQRDDWPVRIFFYAMLALGASFWMGALPVLLMFLGLDLFRAASPRLWNGTTDFNLRHFTFLGLGILSMQLLFMLVALAARTLAGDGMFNTYVTLFNKTAPAFSWFVVIALLATGLLFRSRLEGMEIKRAPRGGNGPVFEGAFDTLDYYLKVGDASVKPYYPNYSRWIVDTTEKQKRPACYALEMSPVLFDPLVPVVQQPEGPKLHTVKIKVEDSLGQAVNRGRLLHGTEAAVIADAGNSVEVRGERFTLGYQESLNERFRYFESMTIETDQGTIIKKKSPKEDRFEAELPVPQDGDVVTMRLAYPSRTLRFRVKGPQDTHVADAARIEAYWRGESESSIEKISIFLGEAVWDTEKKLHELMTTLPGWGEVAYDILASGYQPMDSVTVPVSDFDSGGAKDILLSFKTWRLEFQVNEKSRGPLSGANVSVTIGNSSAASAEQEKGLYVVATNPLHPDTPVAYSVSKDGYEDPDSGRQSVEKSGTLRDLARTSPTHLRLITHKVKPRVMVEARSAEKTYPLEADVKLTYWDRPEGPERTVELATKTREGYVRDPIIYVPGKPLTLNVKSSGFETWRGVYDPGKPTNELTLYPARPLLIFVINPNDRFYGSQRQLRANRFKYFSRRLYTAMKELASGQHWMERWNRTYFFLWDDPESQPRLLIPAEGGTFDWGGRDPDEVVTKLLLKSLREHSNPPVRYEQVIAFAASHADQFHYNPKRDTAQAELVYVLAAPVGDPDLGHLEKLDRTLDEKNLNAMVLALTNGGGSGRNPIHPRESRFTNLAFYHLGMEEEYKDDFTPMIKLLKNELRQSMSRRKKAIGGWSP